MIIRSLTGLKAASGRRHHSEHDVYGEVVAGRVHFDNAADAKCAITVGPRGFFHVPPHSVHRESDPPADEPGEIILFLPEGGSLVFNVEDADKS